MRNATDLHKKCNQDDRSREAEREKRKEKQNIAQMNGIAIPSYVVITHTAHTCNSKRTRFICTFLSGNVLLCLHEKNEQQRWQWT